MRVDSWPTKQAIGSGRSISAGLARLGAGAKCSASHPFGMSDGLKPSALHLATSGGDTHTIASAASARRSSSDPVRPSGRPDRWAPAVKSSVTR